MREILFRGFYKDEIYGKHKAFINGEWINGDWAQGLPFDYDDVLCIGNSISANDYSEILGDYAEVYPETVGQYIGLKDVKGKRIFEGDIVLTQEYYNRPYSKNRKSKRHVGVVKYEIQSGKGFYNKDTGKMDRKCDYGAEWMVSVKDYGVYVHGAWGDFFDCEVIGNIYDNPELLKGVTDA